MAPSPQTSVEKANEIGVEALKQIITLASAILALTITFLKDALGDARSSAVATILVPASWLLLVSSIWAAWVAIVEVAKTLAAISGPPLFVFDRDVDKKTEDATLREKVKRTRRFSVTAQWLFLFGIALLTVFALINWNLFFVQTKTGESPQPTPTVTVSPTFAPTALPTVTPSPQQTPAP